MGMASLVMEILLHLVFFQNWLNFQMLDLFFRSCSVPVKHLSYTEKFCVAKFFAKMAISIILRMIHVGNIKGVAWQLFTKLNFATEQILQNS